MSSRNRLIIVQDCVKILLPCGGTVAALPSTNTLKANPNRLAFFCLLARVCAGSCGFLRTSQGCISASNRRVLLSVCVFSLRPSAPPVQWTKISNVKSYSGFDGSASEIERTNFDSTAKEFILGLFDPGAFAIEVDQDNSDAGQLALMTALVTGVAKSFKLLLPNGNTATFTAYVKKFNSQGAVDQAIRRSAELRISGSITWA